MTEHEGLTEEAPKKRAEPLRQRKSESKAESNEVSLIFKVSTVLLSTIALLYGVLSFSRPDIIDQALNNFNGTAAIVFGLGVFLYIFSSVAVKMGAATFQKGNSSYTHAYTKFYSDIMERFGGVGAGVSLKVESTSKADEKPIPESNPYAYAYGAASQETFFEQYISEILLSLSAYASSSEKTADKLLDKGVMFMTVGLVFYVVAIFLWQLVANLTSPDAHVMYIGMAACSMTFIVIEFLAAWFFKQYRYYVEVSLSCLRVRSVYDRYLLSYYSLGIFSEDNQLSARDKMIEVLKEDVKWPTYKGAASNDFNYMMESMGAAHTSLEKIRKVFKDSGKGKAQ